VPIQFSIFRNGSPPGKKFRRVTILGFRNPREEEKEYFPVEDLNRDCSEKK
jgi:hypothetical protein